MVQRDWRTSGIALGRESYVTVNKGCTNGNKSLTSKRVTRFTLITVINSQVYIIFGGREKLKRKVREKRFVRYDKKKKTRASVGCIFC